MGREAHVTRLALGRSPFGEPLRDEDGEFILGPHAHDDDAPGYRQEFNERGHPQNRASRAAAKRLRKAQNDVLATVGVVVRKGEERKSRWEKLEDSQKFDIIHQENDKGSFLKGEDRIAGVVLPWCITSLRRRLMVFDQYSSVQIAGLVFKECHLFGLPSFLFAGFPFHFLSSIPQMFRYYICDPTVEEIVNFINPWQKEEHYGLSALSLRWHITPIILRCIELPFLVHATLQTLQIIPANIGLGWRSLVPFSATSPIAIPLIPSNSTATGFLKFVVELMKTPLMLYLIRDYVQVQIRYRLYALMRQLVVKPDLPDTISARVSDEYEALDATSIAGVGFPWSGNDAMYRTGRRYFGPKSFIGALRLSFPFVYDLMNRFTKGRLARSRGRLTPLLERQLRAAVRDRYWEDRMDLVPLPRRGSPDDITFRRNTVYIVFRTYNLDAYEELVDVDAWTNDALGPKADIMRLQSPLHPSWNSESGRPNRPVEPPREPPNTEQQNEIVSNVLAEAFRAMPVSDAVIIQANDGPVMMFNQQAPDDPLDVAEMNNIHTIDAAEVPLAALIRAATTPDPDDDDAPQPPESQTEEQRPPAPQAPSTPSSPPTPIQALSRARSITDPQVQSPNRTSIRPLRRPTETDDSLAAISETLRAEAENLQSPHFSPPPSPPTERRTEPLHEVMETDPAPAPDPALLPQKHRLYRVTMLSNFPADSLAWHASGLLTSLITWPLEAIWLRAVADWALQNDAMGPYIDPWWAARLGFGVVGGGRPVYVLGLGRWFGGATDPPGRLRYMGSILLTLGLEGMVRGICWGFGVWCVKRWKGRYGWGQF